MDMSKNVTSLSKERRKRKPRSLEEMVASAFRHYNNPDFLAKVGKEPDLLASGCTNAQGGFIRDDEDDRLADSERDEDESEK